MELTIAFCGDIMLGAEVAKHIGSRTVGDWLRHVSSAWKDADLLIGNLESPCVNRARPLDGPVPEIVFHAPASRLGELKGAGFSAVSLANNHILNCGPAGLRETIESLQGSGLRYAGAGMNLREALTPALIRVREVTVGFVAFCYGPPAGRKTAGAAPHDRKSMREALLRARGQADIVVAALHDGLEYSDVPPSETRSRFRFLAENGADVVVGHHPHVLQGLEWVGNVPVAYSLGDFLFHNSLPEVAERNFRRMALGLYAPDEVARDREKFGRGAVLTVRFSGERRSVRWHPFRQGADLRPRLCAGAAQEEDLRRLEDLSCALQNESDHRRRLADAVMETVRTNSVAQLGIRDLLKLARTPKWRYLPRGWRWLYQRLKLAHGQQA